MKTEQLGQTDLPDKKVSVDIDKSTLWYMYYAPVFAHSDELAKTVKSCKEKYDGGDKEGYYTPMVGLLKSVEGNVPVKVSGQALEELAKYVIDIYTRDGLTKASAADQN